MDGKIEELKKEKRTLKTSITKLLNELAAELSTKMPNKENVTAKLQDIDKRRDELLELLDSLQTLYGDNKHASLAASTGDEADKMIDRVDNETKEARLFLSQSNSKESEGNNTSQLGTFESAHGKDGHVVDANKQLERIRIPKFSGDKKEYQSWWAAFSSCVDETNLSAQFKMLRLESCLVGEAAETVKGLGYSDHAYEAAKARLNRKYGGNRRQVQAHIDELRKMRPINADNPRELERFADIVERTVVSLKENKKFADLEGGTLYAIVLEKLPQALLSQYYRWIKEKGSLESLEELRRWVAEEAEYQVQASEIKHGLSSVGSVRGKSSTKSYFGTTEEKRDRPCKVCNQKHPIWKCDMFKGMEHRKKWETAKKLGLCYRCLGKGHLGDSCTWNRECGIDGCKDRHHRLLHEEKVASGTMEGKADTPVTEENKSSTYETVIEHAQRSIALRTVPVTLKHGERRLQVNCFLDEGSDTSYVNEDVVEELGLYGRKEKVIINVANGQKVNLMSATMEIGLESLDGRVDTVIVAKTSNNICGGMKPIIWLRIKDQWKHLREIPSPKLGKRSKIDVLIGLDHYNLLFPMKEVRGGDNDPSARLSIEVNSNWYHLYV